MVEAFMTSNKNEAKGKNEVKNKKKRKTWTISIVIAAFLFFSCISAVISFTLIYKDSIHNGISIENVDVGGLTVVDANNKIEESLKYVLDNDKLILRYEDKTWKFSPQDIGLKYDFLKAVNDAYLIGRRGTFFDRIHTMIDLLNEPYDMSLKSSLDMEKMNNILSIIEKDINNPGLNASIKRENDVFIIKDESMGFRLNKEKTLEEISKILLDSNFYDINEVDLIVETITPKYTSEMLSKVQDLLGSYTTKFNTRKVGRSYNVGLASKSVDGTLLLPGEIFSFNDIVGPRTIKNGYKIAPVIFKGELVDGVGGGICQVSSTLYNSVLYSSLGIVERANHTIPSTYVPIGLDATVSYGVLDFKFQNTLSSPIYIESLIKGNKITVNIYGERNFDKEIKLKSVIDKVIKKDTEIIFDPNMFEGDEMIEEKGRNGFRVSSYMLVYQGGKFVEKKLVANDYYRPRKQIIKKGSKKPVNQNDEINNNDINNNDGQNGTEINN
jgi:vancomycin resistance protein YoaR